MTELPPADGRPAEDAGPVPARVRPGPRPVPGPSPTSRARRSAAGAPDGLRRPRPTPHPDAPHPDALPAVDLTKPVRTDQPAPADQPAPVGSAVTTDTTATPASAVDLTKPGDRSLPPTRRRASAALVALLAALLLALAGLDGWLLTHQPGAGSRSERDQALSTAKTAVPAILSYDYRHFDADVGTARGRLTGRAVDDYVQASKTIKSAAAKAHAVVQAQTDGAGVEAVSSDGKQVTVVVFGEQKVTNTSLSQPRIDLFRVRVTLDLVDGQWLVSKFAQI